ncbi:MAG: hypothetical protein Tsb002_32270 [Wenzhouxiangellaceae bacterium]
MRCWLSVLILSTLLAPARAQIMPLPSPAASGSLAPRLTSSATASPWLSWLEPVDNGYALRISNWSDQGFGPAITVASGADWFINWADTPHLWIDSQGRMLAHWLQKSADSTFAYDVMLAHSANGAQWSQPYSPHADSTPTEHGFASAVPLDDGMLIAWLDGRATLANDSSTSGAMSLRAARISAGGQIEERMVLDQRVCDCCQTDAAMTTQGPVVVYRDRDDDEVRNIAMVHYSTAGWSKPVTVHNDGWKITGCPVNGPQVVSLGDEVAVVWFTMANNLPTVKVARSVDRLSRFEPPYTLSRATPLGRVAISQVGVHLAIAWIEEQSERALLQLAIVEAETLREQRRQVIATVPRGRASGFPALAAINQRQLLIAWTDVIDGARQIKAATYTLP